MGNITQMALRAATDEELLYEKYSTADAVLDYLLEESNFKSLADVLKETMVKAGLCEEDISPSKFVEILHKCIKVQDEECGLSETISRKTVNRWLTGATKSIRDRDDAIKICFALKLNLELTTNLLCKCGFSVLNVRSAKDATYLYCILNNRPWNAANHILESYCTSSSEEDTKVVRSQNDHSGSTTILMENQLFANSDWENDDEFLNTFLIPNKSKFIGYAKTALNEYYTLKNKLYLLVFMYTAHDEEHLIFERYEDIENDISQKDIPVSLAVRSALRKSSNSSLLLYPAFSLLKEDLRNTMKALDEVLKIADSNTDIESQIQISDFLNDIMKTEGFLKYTIECIRGKDGRIRKYSDSELKDSVMKEFPDDHSFANFEKDPSRISQGMAVRKALILMYYMAYSFEYSSYLTDYEYTSDLFGEMGFSEFIEGLNKILSNCKLAPLYPANQFDWLILRSIREFEVSENLEDNDSPLDFFNEVISFSFPPDPETIQSIGFPDQQ